MGTAHHKGERHLLADDANGHERKTAAVFGFFGASDRELALIEKRYAKNGYDCVVVPSPSLP